MYEKNNPDYNKNTSSSFSDFSDSISILQGASMTLWFIGMISIVLGTIEQFLINESRIMAAIILLM
jgi:hypothetical protein